MFISQVKRTYYYIKLETLPKRRPDNVKEMKYRSGKYRGVFYVIGKDN